MSGALLFWIIVLLCWSISSQLTTCTFRVIPVLALYAAANWFQNAAVWSFEYSAATILIDLTAVESPLSLLDLSPVPPPQAAKVSARPQIPAARARERVFMEGSPVEMGRHVT